MFFSLLLYFKWWTQCQYRVNTDRQKSGRKFLLVLEVNLSLLTLSWISKELSFPALTNHIFNPAGFHLFYNSIMMNFKIYLNFQGSLETCFISLTSHSFTFLIFSFPCKRSKNYSNKTLLRFHYTYCVLFIPGYTFKLTIKKFLMSWSTITNCNAVSVIIEKKIGPRLFFYNYLS